MSKEKNHNIVIVLAIITFFIVYQDKIIGEKNTMEIHNEIITLDTHCDIDINKVSTASRTLEKVVDSKYFYGELYKFDSV